MTFTKADRNLLVRVTRHVREAAETERNSYGTPAWGDSAESKQAKRRYDRMKRDERDVIALRKRLEQSMDLSVPDCAPLKAVS